MESEVPAPKGGKRLRPRSRSAGAPGTMRVGTGLPAASMRRPVNPRNRGIGAPAGPWPTSAHVRTVRKGCPCVARVRHRNRANSSDRRHPGWARRCASIGRGFRRQRPPVRTLIVSYRPNSVRSGITTNVSSPKPRNGVAGIVRGTGSPSTTRIGRPYPAPKWARRRRVSSGRTRRNRPPASAIISAASRSTMNRCRLAMSPRARSSVRPAHRREPRSGAPRWRPRSGPGKGCRSLYHSGRASPPLHHRPRLTPRTASQRPFGRRVEVEFGVFQVGDLAVLSCAHVVHAP